MGGMDRVSPAWTRKGHGLRTERETSQPDRKALVYWASGLETTYYEGALERAIR